MDDKHPLSEWIAQRSSRADFARAVGCSESHLSLIISRSRGASLGLAQRISAAADGSIPIEAVMLPRKRFIASGGA